MSQQNSVSHRDTVFWSLMTVPMLLYLLLLLAMLVAVGQFTTIDSLGRMFRDPQVQYSMRLSILSCTISAVLAIWIAVPSGYVLARWPDGEGFPARYRRWIDVCRWWIDTMLDIPIVLPPMVVGIGLLVLFQTPLGRVGDALTGRLFPFLGWTGVDGITYEIPAVIIAQTVVATAFAIRTMRETFERMDARPERIARTLGASRSQTFRWIAFPQSMRGIAAATTLAWARSLGEFGPILIFAGTTPMKTEVLPTTVYLRFQSGRLQDAISASVILIGIAVVVLLILRWAGSDRQQSRM